jgi:hypothetical protein
MHAATAESHILSEKFAALHWQSLREGELSRELGLDAIYVFYDLLVNSSHGRVFYSKTTSGDILSLCCVLTDYDAFSRMLNRRLLAGVLKKIMLGKLSPFVLLKELQRRKRDLPVSLRKVHLGMIVRNAAYGPVATYRLTENLRDALAYLGSLGLKEVWASSLKTNQASILFLERNGFAKYCTHADIVFLTYLLKN